MEHEGRTMRKIYSWGRPRGCGLETRNAEVLGVPGEFQISTVVQALLKLQCQAQSMSVFYSEECGL